MSGFLSPAGSPVNVLHTSVKLVAQMSEVTLCQHNRKKLNEFVSILLSFSHLGVDRVEPVEEGLMLPSHYCLF